VCLYSVKKLLSHWFRIPCVSSLMTTHHHSVVKSGGCFFVNTITSKRLNIGWWNLAARCIVQKSPSFEFRGQASPLGPHTWKCEVLPSHFATLQRVSQEYLWALGVAHWPLVNKNKNSLCIVICTSIAENSEKVVPCKYVVLLFLFDPKN